MFMATCSFYRIENVLNVQKPLTKYGINTRKSIDRESFWNFTRDYIVYTYLHIIYLQIPKMNLQTKGKFSIPISTPHGRDNLNGLCEVDHVI